MQALKNQQINESSASKGENFERISLIHPTRFVDSGISTKKAINIPSTNVSKLAGNHVLSEIWKIRYSQESTKRNKRPNPIICTFVWVLLSRISDEKKSDIKGSKK